MDANGPEFEIGMHSPAGIRSDHRRMSQKQGAGRDIRIDIQLRLWLLGSFPSHPAMHLDAAIAHCLGKPHATEETPFGPEVLVYKVAGKMFALTDPGDFPATLNLKCEPGRALDLRDQYPAIQPGYHMNKRHWNTLTLDGSLPAAVVKELIDHSYDLVVGGLPRKDREAIGRGKG